MKHIWLHTFRMRGCCALLLVIAIDGCKNTGKSLLRDSEGANNAVAIEYPSLGNGYDSIGQRTLQNTCLHNPQIIKDDSVSNSMYFDGRITDISKHEFSSFFSAGGEITLALDLAKGSDRADFFYSGTETSDSVNFGMAVLHETSTHIVANGSMDPRFISADEDAQRRRCGDSYIGKIVKGGRFAAYIKYIFSSREAKSSFENKIAANIKFIGSVELVGAALSESQQRSSRVIVEYMQEGGAIAGAGVVLGQHSIIRCGLDPESFAECANIIRALSVYATTKNHPGFASSLTNNNAVWLTFEPTLYPNVRPVDNLLVQETAIALEKNIGLQDRLSELIFDATTVSNETRAMLRQRLEGLREDYMILEQNSGYCTALDPQIRQEECQPVANLNLRHQQYELDRNVYAIEWLPPIGASSDGTYFEYLCPNFLTAILGTKTGANLLGKVQAGCDNSSSVDYGKAIGSRIVGSCDGGGVVVGLQGSSNGGINGLALRCASLKGIRDNSMTIAAAKSIDVLGGANVNSKPTISCPQGKAARGIAGRFTNDSIISLSLICGTILQE